MEEKEKGQILGKGVITIKAMFFTTEENKDTERTFKPRNTVCHSGQRPGIQSLLPATA